MGNLHLITGYAGAEHITSADAGSFNTAMFGGGQYILDRGSKLAISVISNNQVRIADGDMLLHGRHIRLNENAYVDLTIENGEQGMLRNDLIVCRYTKDSGTGVEQANLVVIKGASAASNPADPAHNEGNVVNGDMTVDFPLYRIPLDGLNVGTPVALFGDVYSSSTKTFTVDVGTSWTADSTNGGYTQTISVPGILESNDPIYDVVLGTDVDANELYLDAFALVTRLTTTNDQIKLWANVDAPTSAFTLKLKVVR